MDIIVGFCNQNLDSRNLLHLLSFCPDKDSYFWIYLIIPNSIALSNRGSRICLQQSFQIGLF